ncbi:MAG TPA: MlaD family protein [Gammaproteobacteria bacterium]|nr:MlaD family protein [Gammaproteobacteria bacterium]
METNVNYTLVGAFVILLFSAVVMSIIWLSSGFSFQKYTTYAIYMQESVSGLTPESQVEFNGVSVGTVNTIEIDAKNPHLVDVTLNIKSNTPVTRGTVATLATRGLTGMVYIALKDKSVDLRPLEIKSGEKYPVIQTSPSIFVRIDTAVSQLSESFNKLSSSVSSLLDPQNLNAIKETLINLQKITQNLSNNGKRINAAIGHTSEAMRVFETQTLPEASMMLNNMSHLTQDLSEVASEVRQNPAVLIRGKAPQALGPGED